MVDDQFSQLLWQHMARRDLASARKLSAAVRDFYSRRGEKSLVDLPHATIQHWVGKQGDPPVLAPHGRAKRRERPVGRPQRALDVLRASAALGLNKVQATRLLLAAGKPAVDQLLAASQQDEYLAIALRPWQQVAPNNLPAALTSFVGRHDETLDLAELLADPAIRLATLVGPGGSGKTRLALEAAHFLLDAFADGVYFVPLETVEDAQQVPGALLRALGQPRGESTSQQQRLVDVLRARHLLLIIDNAEHLPGLTPQLAELLSQASRVQVLATSRTPLGLYGEHERPVLPFAIPESSRQLAQLRANPALALFAERASAVAPGFSISRDNGEAIRQICTLLGGLPLAIELAAARVREYPPQELLQRYRQSLDLAAGGPSHRATRQQSLRQALDWSYRLLSPEERALFPRLAIFRGSWPRSAVAAVCGVGPNGGPGTDTSLDAVLDRLVAHSLVVAGARGSGKGYRLLEPVHEYAREVLSEHEDIDALARRHAEWCVALGERVAYPLQGGADGAAWLADLDREFANIRAALDWTDQHDPALALRLVAAIWPYWFIRQELDEGQRWVQRALDRAPASSLWRAQALCGLGMLHFWHDSAIAYDRLGAALTLAEAQRDSELVASIRWPLAFAALAVGKADEARAQIDAGWPLADSPDRLGLRGAYRMMRGYLGDQAGHPDARRELRAALADAARADQPLIQCMIIARLNGLSLQREEYDRSREEIAELQGLAERIGATFYRLLAWFRLGMLHEARGDWTDAEEAYRKCLRFAEESERSRFERAASLLGLGRLALIAGRPREAQQLLRDAAELAGQMKNQRLVREVSLPLALALWDDQQTVEALSYLSAVLEEWGAAGEPRWLIAWGEVAAAIATNQAGADEASWIGLLEQARKELHIRRPAFLQPRVAAAPIRSAARSPQSRPAPDQARPLARALAEAKEWLPVALEREYAALGDKAAD